ncbi:hypothetical protein [Umezawaea beigongshangensis]|uniref:hypothetical protein n=1 Tax=Umezawaea beigongshangensis TaxID=2780383 RepID=UPI0018F20CA7|nr:hypothetical protein [Umezawaea beigongshangensis]
MGRSAEALFAVDAEAGEEELLEAARGSLRAALTGDAETGAAELRRLVAADDRPSLRRHLALALVARSAEVRSETRTGELVIVTPRQLAVCAELADDLLSLGVPDPEITAFAAELRDEAAAGLRWEWTRRGPAAAFGVAATALGALPVVLGGLRGEPGWIALGCAAGTVLLFLMVVAARQQRWRVRATAVAPLVSRPGR